MKKFTKYIRATKAGLTAPDAKISKVPLTKKKYDMSVYMKNYGRPIGVEPKIFLVCPRACDCDAYEHSPWRPTIEVFATEFEARRYFKKYYPRLYKELEIIYEDTQKE